MFTKITGKFRLINNMDLNAAANIRYKNEEVL